jgi:hypothetical protein
MKSLIKKLFPKAKGIYKYDEDQDDMLDGTDYTKVESWGFELPVNVYDKDGHGPREHQHQQRSAQVRGWSWGELKALKQSAPQDSPSDYNAEIVLNIYDDKDFQFFMDSAPIAVSLHTAPQKRDIQQTMNDHPLPISKLNAKIAKEIEAAAMEMFESVKENKHQSKKNTQHETRNDI